LLFQHVVESVQSFHTLLLAMRSLIVPALISGAFGHGWLSTPTSRAVLGCDQVGNWYMCKTHQATYTCDGLPCGECDEPGYEPGTGGNCTAGLYPGMATPREPYCNPNQMPGTSFLETPGEIQASWKAGEVVEVAWYVSVSHSGSYQYRLCLDGSDTEDCFKKTPLRFADGEMWHQQSFCPDCPDWPLMVDRVVIPSDIQCDHCTFAWRWDAYHESTIFTGCADVAISSQSATPSSSQRTHAIVHAHRDRTGAFLK